MNAEDRVKQDFTDEEWDDLSPKMRQRLIDKEQLLIDQEHSLLEKEHHLIVAQQQLAEQERVLLEAEPIVQRHREFIKQEEDTKRAVETTVSLLREKGIPERIGASDTPKKKPLIATEEDHIDISCEFTYNEPNPVSYIGGLIQGFQRSTIHSILNDAQLILDKSNSHENVRRSASAYMLFHLWSGGTRRSGTNIVIIGDKVSDHLDELFIELDDLIEGIKIKAGAYDFVYNGEQKCYIHFYFKASYYLEPECIDNWGSNIKAIEERKDFNIFTANKRNIPCIQQVSERLFNDITNIKTLKDILDKLDNNVCILKPYHYIKYLSQIKTYRDLIIHNDSPIKSFSVIDKDITYLLMFNKHIGILENCSQPKKNPYKTIFRPIEKYLGTKNITVCFDIECYFDPLNDQKHVPYLCCCCFLLDDEPVYIKDYLSKDCVALMIEYCVDVANELNITSIELIAHNGGAYDFHYLLTAMVNPSIIKNILIRNNNFISFSFEHQGIKFTVKDSLNFMLCSLQNASKAFLGKAEKTSFPHHEVKTEQDLQKVFNEWESIDKEIDVNTEKEKCMVVKSKDVIKYKDNGESKKLIDVAIEYCINDVIVLAKVWSKFKATVFDVFNCKIVDNTYTLAGMSFRLFEAHLHSRIDGKLLDLKHPNKKEYMQMRKSLIGGRCISVNGIYEDIVCLDVKSLYPAAMAYYEQPYGVYRKVTEEIPYEIELGIYYCKVKAIKINKHGFFPLRKGDKVSYIDSDEEYEGWYTSVDILIGREEGHNIEVIPFENKFVGYSWKHKGKIFKDYIEKVLYKLKLQYEQEGKKEQRWIIKIVMNSLWGKFAQKWINNNYKIKEEHDVKSGEKAEKIFDTNYMIVKLPNMSEQADKPLQNGIYTLSWARYHMYKTWKAIAKDGAVCVYSDTDSIMVHKDDIDMKGTISINDKVVPAIGEEMGQLEIEATFYEFITVGKKQYIGKYGGLNNPKFKKRFKGVPLQYIRPELFSHLIKYKDNVAEINFLKFKREWGVVKGYIENKTVKQT